MTRRPAYLLVIGVLVAGCATEPTVTELELPRATVTQVNRTGLDEYVTCTACPARTVKVVAMPKPRPAAAPASPGTSQADQVSAELMAKRQAANASVSPETGLREPTGPLAVHFRFDHSDLDDQGRQELAAAVATARRVPSKRIIVEGRTDGVGPERYNRNLAAERAETVANGLRAAGVDPSAISIVIPDDCCGGDPAAADDLRRLERRADVRLHLVSEGAKP